MVLSRKLMFDTSVFNYIHEYDLYSEVESFLSRNKNIRVYVCDTQEQELSAMSDTLKKKRIEMMRQNILVQPVTCSLGIIGTDSPHKFGYKGARVGAFRVADIDESKHDDIEKLMGSKGKNPLGNGADLTIIDTAITKEMDYLVTRDKEIQTTLPTGLKEVRIYSKSHPELKIKLIKEKIA